MRDFHDNCNGAKVVGTTLSVGGGILTAGSFLLRLIRIFNKLKFVIQIRNRQVPVFFYLASLVGAFFTGGATLVAAGIAGTICSGSGAVYRPY